MRSLLVSLGLMLVASRAWADASVRRPTGEPVPRCSYDDSPNAKRPRGPRGPRDPLLVRARAAARVVDGDGRTIGLLRLERLASGTTVTALVDPSTLAQRWRVDGLHGGDDGAAVLTGDGQLVVATFHPFSTGSRLFALDLATGTPRWIADVAQLNVAHSEYFNDVTLERDGDVVVLRGWESGGCTEQRFDWRTGRRLSSTIRRLW
jgi:hypothetical protein